MFIGQRIFSNTVTLHNTNEFSAKMINKCGYGVHKNTLQWAAQPLSSLRTQVINHYDPTLIKHLDANLTWFN